MSTRVNPGRDALLAMLGAAPGTSVAAAHDSYLARRRMLLAIDPDPRRPEVVRLDEAFSRLRGLAALERRLETYAHAQVRLAIDGSTVVVRPAQPGTTEGEFPFDGHAQVHVITAFNPRSERLSPHDNALRQRDLTHLIDGTGMPTWPAVAGSGEHQEFSIVVAGLSREKARDFGASFQQDAIFEWTPTAWCIVPCDDLAPARVLGWSATRIALATRGPAAPAAPRPGVAAGTAQASAAAAEAAAIARAHDVTGTTGRPDSGDVPPQAPPTGPRDLPASRGGNGE